MKGISAIEDDALLEKLHLSHAAVVTDIERYIPDTIYHQTRNIYSQNGDVAVLLVSDGAGQSPLSSVSEKVFAQWEGESTQQHATTFIPKNLGFFDPDTEKLTIVGSADIIAKALKESTLGIGSAGEKCISKIEKYLNEAHTVHKETQEVVTR